MSESHGRRGYEAGCRCETCRAAKAEDNSRQRTCRRCNIRLREPAPGRLCGFCREELGMDPKP